ncbi:MAG TPA: RES domain-containing protein [Nitriliruptorales bacterium]
MWWRIDPDHPHDWAWDGFAQPRHRFDPPSGRFRVRYAANDPVAAARERFPARRIPVSAGRLQLVRLEAPGNALHLTHQVNLDALGLDDRINTARLDRPLRAGADPLLTVGQHLADAVHDWWDGTPPPIVYRTRTLPSARSVAFTGSCAWGAVSTGRLRDATSLLVVLVTDHGFDVPDAWL